MTNQKHNDIKNKQLLIQHLPSIITSRINDHNLFFITMTFKEMRKDYDYIHYQNYFRSFRQQLDNSLMLRARDYKSKSCLIVIPEQNPQVHFHGLMCINKNRSQRFLEKCVTDIQEEYSKRLKANVLSFRLQNKFINPCSNNPLVVSDYRFNPIHSIEEARRCFNYSAKNYTYSNFSDSDIIIETKEVTNPKQERLIAKKRLQSN